MNIHYQGYREGPYGNKGKLGTTVKSYHRTAAVSQYVDQRGVNTFAYKIPDAKQHKSAPFMDRVPRGGAVPRVVGSIGDVENSFVDPNPAIAAAAKSTSTTPASGAQTLVPVGTQPEGGQTLDQSPKDKIVSIDEVPDETGSYPNLDATNPSIASSSNISLMSTEYLSAASSAASSQYFDKETGQHSTPYGPDNSFPYGTDFGNPWDTLSRVVNPANVQNYHPPIEPPARFVTHFGESYAGNAMNPEENSVGRPLRIVTNVPLSPATQYNSRPSTRFPSPASSEAYMGPYPSPTTSEPKMSEEMKAFKKYKGVLRSPGEVKRFNEFIKRNRRSKVIIFCF